MLVPQNHHRIVCQRCGSSLIHITPLCSFCGARLVLPRPGQHYTGSATPFPPVAPAPRPTSAPLFVELLLNCLGIYGVGWLMIGNVGVGISLLVCSIVLWPLILLLILFTLGVMLLCLGPLAIVAMGCNVLLLQRAIKSKQDDGAVWAPPGTMIPSSGKEPGAWILINPHNP